MDYTSESDESLVALVAQAQDGALSELYDRYGRLVFAVAFYIIGDQATAEEITLDVFTRVWQKAETYDNNRARARVWLTSIARNRAIDVLRQRTTRQTRQNETWEKVAAETGHTANHPPENPEKIMDIATRREEIRAAVSQLPAEQKQVVFLAYFKGYTQRQIAEMLNQPLGTVKTRTRLAMEKLRQMLEGEEMASP